MKIYALGGLTPPFSLRKTDKPRDGRKRPVEFFLTAQRRHFASETEKHRGIVCYPNGPSRCFDFVETVKFVLMAKRRHVVALRRHRQTCGIVLVFEYSVNSPLTRYAGALPEGEP